MGRRLPNMRLFTKSVTKPTLSGPCGVANVPHFVLINGSNDLLCVSTPHPSSSRVQTILGSTLGGWAVLSVS